MMTGSNPRGSDRPGRFRNGLPSTLLPLWLDPDAPTCALHTAEQSSREEWKVPRLAKALGLSYRGTQWYLKKSLDKLRSVASPEVLRELLAGA